MSTSSTSDSGRSIPPTTKQKQPEQSSLPLSMPMPAAMPPGDENTGESNAFVVSEDTGSGAADTSVQEEVQPQPVEQPAASETTSPGSDQPAVVAEPPTQPQPDQPQPTQPQPDQPQPDQPTAALEADFLAGLPEAQGRTDRPRDIEEANCGARRSRESDWANTQCHADEVAAEQERQRQDEEARRQREAEAAHQAQAEPSSGGGGYVPPSGGGGYVPASGGGEATWTEPAPPDPGPEAQAASNPQAEPSYGGDYCGSGVHDPAVCPSHAYGQA